VKSLKIKAESFNEWKDPCNKGVSHCSFLVKIKDLPNQSLIPIDSINTRRQNLLSPVARKIVHSAKIDPNLFHLKAKGMTVYARNFKHKDGFVELNLSKFDGLGDGAHSFLSCIEAVKQTRGATDSYIQVSVISGLSEKSQKASCLFRNTSVANKELTRHSYQGHFDILKDSLKNEPYADKISYVENDKKEINPRWIISLLSLFVYEKKNIKDCVISKEKVLKEFIKKQKNLNKEYYLVAEVAKELIDLYEFTICKLSKINSKENLDESESLFKSKKSGKSKTKFKNISLDFSVSDSAVFPILSTFSDNVTWNGSKFVVKNKGKIKKEISDKAYDYYKNIISFLNLFHGNVYKMTVSRDFWNSFKEI
jgi:hypothetical protein